MARTRGATDKTPRKNSRSGKNGSNVTDLKTGQQRAQSAAAGDNGINGDLLEECILAHEEQDKRLATLRGEYMAKCKGPRQAQKDIAEQARSGGIPKRAYKIELQRRALEARATKLRETAEPDDQATLDIIRRILREKLGPYLDLPLGQAAEASATRGARAISSLTGQGA